MSLLRRWPFTFWWLLVFEVGTLLRAWQLTGARMWYDEINTWWWASLPIERTIAATAADVHPPLFYLVEWASLRLFPAGTAPELAMRAPSLVLSVLALPLLFLICRALKVSNAVTLGATLIMALSPAQIYYAQEARMYALLQAEVLLALWAVLTRRWWLVALALTAMLYTHNYGIVYAAVLLCLAVGRDVMEDRTLPARAILIGFGVPLLAFVFWYGVLSHQVATVKETWWTQATGLGDFIGPFYGHVFFSSPMGMFIPICQIVAYGLAGFALFKAMQRVRTDCTGLMLAYLILAPMLLAVGIEAVYRPIYLTRALIGVAAPLYMLIAWAITDRVDVAKRAFAWGVFAPLLVVSLLSYYPAELQFKGWGYSGAGPVIDRLQPGDIVYHVNPGSLVQFHYDWQQADTPQYLAPNSPGSLGTLSTGTLQAMGVQQAALESLQWRRAFVVWNAGPNTSLSEDAEMQSLLDRYPHEQIDANELGWQYDVTDGGVWLVWH